MRRLFANILAIVFALGFTACAAPPAAPVETAAAAPTPTIAPETPQAATPLAPDLSCRTDADCAVKNVGNCCGYYPACVNKDSPADPAAVQAQCRAKGMVGVCGFRQISACTCTAGKCTALAEPVGGWTDGPQLPAKQ